eukprot:Skav205601  [mRNA]  locus=scaffold460:163905:164579:+ [translate_table: standard]
MWFCCAAEEPPTAADVQVVEPVAMQQALPPKKEEAKPTPPPTPPVEPAPEFGCFTVKVPAAPGCFSLGVHIDKTSSTMPMIKEVTEGALQKFNELNPSRKIRPHDVVTAINGAKGTDAIWKKMTEKPTEDMTLEISRPRKIEVSIVKTGGLGLKLDYKSQSLGGVVDEIVAAGIIAKWNQENPSEVVNKGDRIIGCNGKECLGDELLERIKQSDSKLALTVLKY